MSRRRKIGYRRYTATAKQHNGKQDEAGQPTYGTESDWTPIVSGWPVELIGVTGGERIRGRQVAAEATHVIYGEYYGGQGITPEARCVVDGRTFNVVNVLDMDGDHRELRVELKAEL